MLDVFISYSRQSKLAANEIANDIKAMGHIVWFDQEMSGGQQWWETILDAIRNCDLFVVLLTEETLESDACRLEIKYANDLGKPILPIKISEGVSPNVLPFALTRIQIVDYVKKGHRSVLNLARALNNIPPVSPLPEPLPDPPEVPLSYLSKLADTIDSTQNLNLEQQSVLIVDLKRGLRDPETSTDSLVLINRLKKRKDLFASISEEIEDIIQNNKVSPSIVKSNSWSEPERITTIFDVQASPQKTDLKLVCIILIAVAGSLFTERYLYSGLKFHFMYFQFFSAIYIGYKYNHMVALLSGMIIFLPNFILHLIGSFGLQGSYDFNTYNHFFGDMRYSDLHRTRTFGIAYLPYASLGFIVAFVKGKIQSLEEKAIFISFKKYQISNLLKVNFIILMLLLSLSISTWTGNYAFSGRHIVYSLIFLWVYKYGIKQLRWLFIVMSLIHTIKFSGDSWFVFDVFGYNDLILFLLFIIFTNYLKISSPKLEQTSIFAFTVAIYCFISGFSIRIMENSFIVVYQIALPFFLWFGYKFGSDLAFRAGIIWGCFMSFQIGINWIISWGFADLRYIIFAAMLGYFGGIDIVKANFLKTGAKIILMLHSVVICVDLMTMGLSINYARNMIFIIVANLIILLLFSAFTKREQQLSTV